MSTSSPTWRARLLPLHKELAFENVWKEVHHRYTHNLAFVAITQLRVLLASAGGSRIALRHARDSRARCTTSSMSCATHVPIYPLCRFPPVVASCRDHRDCRTSRSSSCSRGMFAYAKARVVRRECFAIAPRVFCGVVRAIHVSRVESTPSLIIWASLVSSPSSTARFNPFR